MKKIKTPKPIGKITHYFSDIKVAVIKVISPFKKGDEIRITGGEETDFEQKVVSMQVEHKDVKSAKKGQSVGIKAKEKVREGYKVYKA
jgi:putative protease